MPTLLPVEPIRCVEWTLSFEYKAPQHEQLMPQSLHHSGVVHHIEQMTTGDLIIPPGEHTQRNPPGGHSQRSVVHADDHPMVSALRIRIHHPLRQPVTPIEWPLPRTHCALSYTYLSMQQSILSWWGGRLQDHSQYACIAEGPAAIQPYMGKSE